MLADGASRQERLRPNLRFQSLQMLAENARVVRIELDCILRRRSDRVSVGLADRPEQILHSLQIVRRLAD
jgi:hypothetical protein